jgi:hypothetical protein
MRFAWALVAVVAGCRFDLPKVGSVDATAEIDAQVFCYGMGLVTPCFPSAPTGDVVLPSAIDTGSSQLCSKDVTNANDYCVIAGASISAPVLVSVTGPKPLVLVAVTTITISGGLDAASHRTPAKLGPGANASSCMMGTAPGTNGGGAGGTMIGIGGAGGGNAVGANMGVPNTTPQTATLLRGGCPGQAAGGRGGNGGGALYLIADTSISVEARSTHRAKADSQGRTPA